MTPTEEQLIENIISRSASEEEIRGVIDAIIDAWNRHDMDAFVAVFTSDADFVNVIGTRFRGVQEIKDAHVQIHRTFMRNTTLRVLDVSVRTIGAGVALAHCRWELTGMEMVPGWNAPSNRRGIFTYVLVNQQGKWLITAAQNTDEVEMNGKPVAAR